MGSARNSRQGFHHAKVAPARSYQQGRMMQMVTDNQREPLVGFGDHHSLAGPALSAQIHAGDLATQRLKEQLAKKNQQARKERLQELLYPSCNYD